MLATSVANRPTVCPAASTTYHLRFSASPLPLGKYVDIDNSLWKKRLKRERVEYRNAQKNVKLKAAIWHHSDQSLDCHFSYLSIVLLSHSRKALASDGC